MFQSFSKEAMTALLSGDTGFREYLSALPDAENKLLRSLFDSPDILNSLISYLPPDQQSAVLSLIRSFQETPDKALKLYEACRFFEARDYLLKTVEMYVLPPGIPEDAVCKAAGYVAERVRALCYELLGDVELTLGNVAKAGEYHHRALELAEHCGDLDTEAKALHGLGCYFRELGDYEQALEHSLRALDILEGRPDRWSTTLKVLHALSLIHGELSRIDDALDYGGRALALAEAQADVRLLPNVLSGRAVLLTGLGLLEEVPPLLDRALAIAVDTGMIRQEALVRHNLGMHWLNTAVDTDDVAAAMLQFGKSLECSRRINAVSLEALARSGMANALVMKDDVSAAEDEYRKAIELRLGIGAIADAADSLVDLGNLLRFRRGASLEAFGCYREAIGLVEQIRSKLKRETHRIGLSEARTEPYHQAITTLLELGREEEAFHYLERARSKALIELLAGQFSAGEGDGLFCQAAELARRIEEMRRTLDELRNAEETSAGGEGEENIPRVMMRCELNQGLEEEERKFASLCEELHRTAPDLNGMLAVQAADSSAVREILPAGTALLELYQSGESLFLFIVRPALPVDVVEVQLTAEEAADTIYPFIMALRDPATLDSRSHDYIRSVRQPASQLHELVFGSLEEQLEGVRRLLIVPHLFWHYLPFHALYDGERREFLLDRFEISYAPSASALVACRDRKRFSRSSALILCRNDGDLPHVEKEGAAIGKVFDRCSIFHGKEAVLDKVSRRETADVIHFACHGFFDPEQPFLSGLAIPPASGDDRPTFLMDFMRMRLESSLVTLSACDTGLSTISNADELVGLSRGIFGSGAASLMLSLWKVADSSTAYLMENFYWHYVANRQTKGRALQLAMQAVRAKPEYAHPYFWAPFVVLGEWE